MLIDTDSVREEQAGSLSILIKYKRLVDFLFRLIGFGGVFELSEDHMNSF